MKILYFSDRYGYHNEGTKKSIFDEMHSRGHHIIWIDKKNISRILHYVNTQNPDQIWLSHTGLKIPSDLKSKIKVPVIGFSFSDPYFKTIQPNEYNIYITNYWNTFKKYKDKVKCIYNPTACDFRFHKPIFIKKKYKVSVIGLGRHPRFKNPNLRIDFVQQLRRDLPSIEIHCFGRAWPKHIHNHKYITGDNFLRVINQSVLGLDIQEEWCPLAHRMLEYGACGIPIITRERSELYRIWRSNKKDILTYKDYKELITLVKVGLNGEFECWGKSARETCLKQNNISHRIDHILRESENLLKM